MLPWAITRAEEDAARTCFELRAAGLRAFPLPCIERVGVEVDPWRPEGMRVVLATSSAVGEVIGRLLPGMEPAVVAALTPATTRALAVAAVKPAIVTSGGVVKLAEAVRDWLDQRRIPSASFWYPTSDAGFEHEEQRQAVRLLEERGAVTRAVAYRTLAPSALRHDLERLPPTYGAIFFSPSAVQHFVAADPPRLPCLVVCHGASTLTAARAHFPAAVEASRARPLIESLHALEVKHV